MIVIDASAIVAIIAMEPERQQFATRIVEDGDVRLSGATLLETSMVLASDRFGRPSLSEEHLEAFIAKAQITIEPVTVEQVQIARIAYRRYGKGTGHGAGLNFGDCFSYALAKALDVPLLYKGGDFGRTDIVSATA